MLQHPSQLSLPDQIAPEFDDCFFPLAVQWDIERLRQETQSLISRVPLAFARTRQIGLHSYPGSANPWYDACRKQSEIGDDTEYTVLHPQLRGTYIEEAFAQLPFEPFRARLMGLESAVCYAIHRDATPRYHVAIETTGQARFVFVDRQRVLHIPADGRVYFVDTRETHTAFNGGKDMRLHIVFGGPVIDRAGNVIGVSK